MTEWISVLDIDKEEGVWYWAELLEDYPSLVMYNKELDGWQKVESDRFCIPTYLFKYEPSNLPMPEWDDD